MCSTGQKGGDCHQFVRVPQPILNSVGEKSLFPTSPLDERARSNSGWASIVYLQHELYAFGISPSVFGVAWLRALEELISIVVLISASPFLWARSYSPHINPENAGRLALPVGDFRVSGHRTPLPTEAIRRFIRSRERRGSRARLCRHRTKEPSAVFRSDNDQCAPSRTQCERDGIIALTRYSRSWTRSVLLQAGYSDCVFRSDGVFGNHRLDI
jgi:hypothetical protein